MEGQMGRDRKKRESQECLVLGRLTERIKSLRQPGLYSEILERKRDRERERETERERERERERDAAS
jgi:hypothetical protein